MVPNNLTKIPHKVLLCELLVILAEFKKLGRIERWAGLVRR